MKRTIHFGIWLPVAIGLVFAVAIAAGYAAAQPEGDSNDARAGPVSQVKPLNIQATELTLTALSNAESADRANAAVVKAEEKLAEQKRTLNDLKAPPPPSATPAELQQRQTRMEQVERQIKQSQNDLSEKTLEATRRKKEFLRAQSDLAKFQAEHPDVETIDLATAWGKLKGDGPITLNEQTALKQAEELLRRLQHALGEDGEVSPILLPGPGRPHDPLPTTRQLEEAELDAAWAQLEGAKSTLENQMQQLLQEKDEIEAFSERLTQQDNRMAEEGASLDAEYKSLGAEVPGLQAADDQLVAEQRSFASRAANLAARIDQHNSYAPDPYDHAAVDRYNAKADRLNAEKKSLEAEERNLMARVDSHSRRVADYLRRENSYNERSEDFNRRLITLQQQFDELQRRSTQWTGQWTAYEILQAEYEQDLAKFFERAQEFMNKWGIDPDNN